MESFSNVFSCNGNTYEQLSYIDLSDCSAALSPQSLLSPGSNIVMSPPAQQVPQDENLYDRMTDNIFYEKTEGQHHFTNQSNTYKIVILNLMFSFEEAVFENNRPAYKRVQVSIQKRNWDTRMHIGKIPQEVVSDNPGIFDEY